GKMLDQTDAVDEIEPFGVGIISSKRDHVAENERAAAAERAVERSAGLRLNVKYRDFSARALEDGSIQLFGTEADVEHQRALDRLQEPERRFDRSLERAEMVGDLRAEFGVGVHPLAPEPFPLILEPIVQVP